MRFQCQEKKKGKKSSALRDDREVQVSLFLAASPLWEQCVWQLWGKFCWRSFTDSPLLLHFSMFKPSLELLCNVLRQNS